MQEEEKVHFTAYKERHHLEEHAVVQHIVSHTGKQTARVRYKIKWQHAQVTTTETSSKMRRLCSSDVSLLALRIAAHCWCVALGGIGHSVQKISARTQT